MVEWLVLQGVNINAINDHNDSPLSSAYKDPDSIACLTMLGAQPRQIEEHLLALHQFPELSCRRQCADLANQLEKRSGFPRLRYQFDAGVLAFVVAKEFGLTTGHEPKEMGSELANTYWRSQFAVNRFLEQAYDDAIKAGCLLIDPHTGTEHGRSVCLFPTSDKFAVMASIGVHDWPDGYGPYGIIRGFKEFDSQCPFALVGCRQRSIDIRFNDESQCSQDAMKVLVNVFERMNKEFTSYFMPTLSSTDTGACVTIDWVWDD